ncbi:Inositol-1-monophosphatase [Nymphon striatum]|nr:Inositol-1-monophosphatase [Nymphon striatum]
MVRNTTERFRATESVEKVRLEQKDYTFLYGEGDMLVFMDSETYEQLELQQEFVGERAAFLQDGMKVTVESHEERPIGIRLPDYVTLEIAEADPVVKGQTVSSSYKPAVMENGVKVMVPPFIDAGEKIVVDTNEALARSALLNVMTNTALKAGRALSRDFGEVQNLQVSKKGTGDFVTNADLRSEKIIREELLEARPDIGFLMEEAGEIKGKDPQNRWIVDPLDGTINFMHGNPHFAISIALEREGEIVAGVIYNPARDELFTAERGQGTFANDKRCRGRKGHGQALREQQIVMRETMGVRCSGSTALDLAYVAAGILMVFGSVAQKLGIMQAGMIIIREAGGYITDIDGGNDLFGKRTVLAGNEFIHRKLGDVVRAVPQK